jgi:type IV pilus assembly protein PilC
LHKGVKSKDLTLFAKTLAILLENGISLVEAFDVIITQVESSTLLEVVKKVKTDIESGSSFRDALSKHPKVFNTYWVDMMEAGELSGKMPYVMREIVAFLEAREQITKKVIGALTYPAMLIIGCLAAVVIFMVKIVPTFIKLFDSLGSQLPGVTMMVVNLSEILQKYFIHGIIIIALFIFGFHKFTSNPTGKRIWESLLFKIPVLGNFLIAVSIEKFVSSLGALLKSGIPIIKAIEVSLKTAQSIIFADNIAAAKMQVMAGVPLSEALQQTGLFPPLTIQLMTVAEKTGNFSGMFDEISNYYKEQIDTLITAFTALLEPLVMVLMTVVVGTLLGALFMPIFSMAGS